MPAAPVRQEVDDDFVVDDEDDGERPKKKAAGAAHSPSVTASGDTVICEFGGRKKVTVNTYQGRVNIHIREVRTQRPRKKSFGLGQVFPRPKAVPLCLLVCWCLPEIIDAATCLSPLL